MLNRVVAWGAMLLLLVLGLVWQTSDAHGSTLNSVSYPPRETGGERFLTLPFTDPRVVVQQGWVGNTNYEHAGIDFILGPRDTGNWQSYDVVASADGWACGNCTTRQGNAVWIRHSVNGKTYYTYYGHLANIAGNIPIGSQQNLVWVQRGQKLGDAGSTGVDGNVIHLHFQVNFGATIVDPSDLWQMRDVYAPGCTNCSMGANYLWTTNPPSLPNDATSPTPAPVPPTATPVPTSTPAPVNNKLTYERTVSGTIWEDSPQTIYYLKASAGDWASMRMFAVGNSSLDTYLKVFAPDGKLLAVDDDGAQVDGNSFLVVKLPQDGTYQVVATCYSGEGDYKLRVEKGTKSALGDLNRDCVVDQPDMQMMSAALGGTDPNADLNLDGVVDAQDQQIQFYRLGRGCMQMKR